MTSDGSTREAPSGGPTAPDALPTDDEPWLVRYIRLRGGRRQVQPNQFSAATLFVAMTLYAFVFALGDHVGWLLIYAFLFCAALFGVHQFRAGPSNRFWIDVAWALPTGIAVAFVGGSLVGPVALGLAVTSAGLAYVIRSLRPPPKKRLRDARDLLHAEKLNRLPDRPRRGRPHPS